MRAVVLHEVDGPLVLERVPEPVGDVVEVRAAGVNFADILIRRGRYPQMPELPYVPGSEVAGMLGDRRVVAFPVAPGGGYAERTAVQPEWTFDLPAGASFASAAGFLLTYLTAYVPLTRQVRVSPGASVLVHAGSGGVGSAAIQLAKHLGAYVVATASSEEKRAFARAQGADEAVGYDELEELRVDVVLDPVGGEVFTRSLPLLSPLGQIVAIGFTAGAWQDPSLAWLVGRNVGVQGVYLGRLMRLEPELVQTCVRELLALWADGRIEPAVGATFPLEAAADAHALIESRRHLGKVVLEP